MNISLPDSLQAFIDQQIATGRCQGPSAYVEALIREDAKRQAEWTVCWGAALAGARL